ncbi:hypothetical protein GYA25_00505 [Candidatus Woesearchaeota archaeon]|nr:hypothetical protein [Candidatus Woesearchaeota archaeon]
MKKEGDLKNKKGLSIIVSYVLLIGISIGLSIIVYTWMKTYVPKESLECPDGVSLSISKITYEAATKRLNITFRNNGRFSIDGFYIRGSNKSAELGEISDLSLAKELIPLNKDQEETIYGDLIRFQIVENSFSPMTYTTRSFNLSKYGTMKKIEIIPTRYQIVNDKKKLLQCPNNKIQEILTFNA